MLTRIAGRIPARRLYVFGLCVALGSAGAASAATIENVIGGNSASNELLGLDFDARIATVLNTDANTRASLRSFDFFDDTCSKRLDVVVADTNRGDLLLYVNGRGDSSYICQGGDGSTCPSRPDGISLSDKRVMAVADTGSAGGIPAVWLFTPEANSSSATCPALDDPFGPFTDPVSTGQLRLCTGNGNNCTPAGGISDTEFVRVPGGGFDAGDLLVLTVNPTTLSRLTSSQVDALRSGGSAASTNARVLVDESGFGGEDPKALAFIPNSAGVGTNDALSESEDLLVAGTNGRILKFRFRSSSGTPVVSSYDPDFLGVPLGNGPLGIAAGIVERELFLVVADRQRGSYLKVPLVDTGASAPVIEPEPCADAECSNWPVITDNIQNPQGVAINTKAVAAEDCDANDQDPTNTGCNIRNTLDLLYSQNIVSCDEFPDDPNCVNDTILASIQVVDDPRNGNLRDISFSALGLDGNYVVPASCQGLRLSDDGRYVLVVAEINKDFRVEPGEYVTYTERAEQLLPQLAACSLVGTRIYHRPNLDDYTYQPEGNALHDITMDCENPSRSLGRESSPLVFCADAYFDPSRFGAPKGKDAKVIQSESFARLGNLAAAINSVDDVNLNGLKPNLLTYVSNAEGYVQKKKFGEASAEMDLGAIYVHQNLALFQAVIPSVPLDPDETAYGDLLGRFLNAAFFMYETATGGDYCVPDEIPLGLSCQSSP